MIDIFIADDHAIVRDGLRRLIEATHGMECVGHAEETAALMKAARSDGESWSVLVLDVSMPGGGGFEAMGQLNQLLPKLPIVVYSMHPEEQYGPRVLRGGGMAYVHKSRPLTDLIKAVQMANNGKRWIPSEIAEQLLLSNAALPHEELSQREFQVFSLLLQDLGPGDIARELHVSPSTVSTHIAQIRTKLGVQTVGGIIRYAFEHGLAE